MKFAKRRKKEAGCKNIRGQSKTFKDKLFEDLEDSLHKRTRYIHIIPHSRISFFFFIFLVFMSENYHMSTLVQKNNFDLMPIIYFFKLTTCDFGKKNQLMLIYSEFKNRFRFSFLTNFNIIIGGKNCVKIHFNVIINCYCLNVMILKSLNRKQ